MAGALHGYSLNIWTVGSDRHFHEVWMQGLVGETVVEPCRRVVAPKCRAVGCELAKEATV